MNDRINLLYYRVRRLLKQFNQNHLEDDEILDLANKVQDDIFINCSIEKTFRIVLKKGITNYDFADESALNIKRITPSWTGSLTRVAAIKWNDYKDVQCGLPTYFAFVGPEFVTNNVLQDNLFVEFLAEQVKGIIPIDENTPPELPEIFDTALVYGILAELTPDAEVKYLDARNTAESRFNNVSNDILTPECEW